MKKLIFIIPVITIALLVLIVMLSKTTTSQNNKISVVAAENFYGNIASQIGGMYVSVHSILADPNIDPHAYEPTSNDAIYVTHAAIVIKNGLGYDSFMDKILSTISNDKYVLNGSKYAQVVDDNPHVWYQVDAMKKFADALRSDLVSLDGTHTSYYQNNYDSFINSLTDIETLCNTIKQNDQGHLVIATERVANYLLSDCGLVPIANGLQKAIEEGNDPSVSDISFFTHTLEQHNLDMLIYNMQTVSKITENIKQIAQSNHIPVIGVTETMPIGSSYQKWIGDELTNINQALYNK